MDRNNGHHEQKIAYARASLWAPFYAVGMAARIQGEVPTESLKVALRKLRILYPPLGSRVRMEKDGTAWLTTDGVGDFPLEVRSRISDGDWAKIFLEQESIPFAFGCGPVARFFLLRGDQVSDLVAIIPHVICDGFSMTYVMCDIVALLNDPNRQVTQPKPPMPVSWENIQHFPQDNLLLRVMARVFNHTYPGRRMVLHQDEYEKLHQLYWARQKNGLLTSELSSPETSALAKRCKQHGICITGALLAAFLLAQAEIQSETQISRSEISVAVNIRDRLLQPPDRVMGIFASSVDLKLRSISGKSFWELARHAHTQIHKSINDRSQVLLPLVLEDLDPSIVDAVVAAVSTDEWSPEFRLLTRFIKIKGEARCLNVSNIGRIDLPELGEPYHLETILPFPPLVPGGGMSLNVLTINGKMNIILKYRLSELDCASALSIRDRALSYLSTAMQSAGPESCPQQI